MEIGEKIKKIRELRNFTQSYMASELEMTQAGYSKIEGGQTDVSYSKIVEISKVLDITPEELLAFDSQKYFNSFNNVKGNNNGSVIIQVDEKIQQLNDDKIQLLTRLLEKAEEEIARLKM